MTTELVTSITDDTLAEIEQALADGGTCTPGQAMALLRAVQANIEPGVGWAAMRLGEVVDLTLYKPRAPGDAGWNTYVRQGYEPPQPVHIGFPMLGKRITRGFLERARQQSHEGFTPAKDDLYTDGQLLKAAAVYLLKAAGLARLRVLPYWPWDRAWFKEDTADRCIEKAFALVVAEMQRRDRSESSAKNTPIA